MTISAVTMGMAGVVLSFLPQEVSSSLGMPETAAVILQVLGALYFGFAMINWTAKANLIGGIYSKPVALGNLAHFVIGALALAKLTFKDPSLSYLWVAALVYSVFAVLFAYVFFTTPDLKSKYS
ncbi:hypothetical protein CA264_18280 [Pontibacter actiniarum]|uniref:Uncharacterized protein n=2 Tax=Pontibacter actiniarum TaxID=323450 RepID=A0A1X9YYP9_9BACT|nr:hypothetical protein CA264_18280 [Pontibacter actiniarum]